MAILPISDQYKYTKRGPFDAKALVKTYAELLDPNTWIVSGTDVAAYNGMITAVWLNTDDTSKNGIYFLHDSAVTTARGTPDVSNEANWHKLGSIDNLPGLAEQISDIHTSLDNMQNNIEDLQDTATVVVESQLPESGVAGKIYVVTETATTYIWHKGEYIPVGDGTTDTDIQIIMGGGPNG